MKASSSIGWILGIVLLISLSLEPALPTSGAMTQEELKDFWLSNFKEDVTKGFCPPLQRQLLAKAEPDECFFGIGDPRNNYNPDFNNQSCSDEGGSPKVNQAYVWGMAKSGDDLWFGTMANVHIIVIGAMISFMGEIPPPIETDSWVAEYGESKFAQPPYSLPPALGDWRPPRIFMYNTLDNTLLEKTPVDPLIATTLGIRSAGTLGNVMLLGGPMLGGGAINLFAFNTETGAYLGSTSLSDYTNIRIWLVVDGVLYAGVGTATGGKVLRWTGDASNPFNFEEVGNLDSDAAYIAFHEGRIFASTWPEFSGGGAVAGLYMSPVVPEGGLTNAQADSWTKVWEVNDYEPDPVIAHSYGNGALASFDGYLYWGTMNVPFAGTLVHLNAYGIPENIEEIIAAILGTQRNISLFRGRNFDSDPEIELIYGLSHLPKYVPNDPLDPTAGGEWEIAPNNMGVCPLYGLSGFGNYFNAYTWAMSVYDNQLFVGTFDWSYLFFDLLESGGVPEELLFLAELFFCEGADLWRFSSSLLPAIPESLDGVGNYTNYGIRNMISDNAFYLGMANPMNLLTDPNEPQGGWELIRLFGSQPKPIIASGDYNGDGISDIAIFRSDNGLWAVRGLGRTYFGASGDIPVSGDYDGDGITDIAIFRPSSGLWAVKDFTQLYFGDSLSQPVPGDYDGNKTCDIAVFGERTGLWSLKGISRVYFGALRDKPVPGDYNSDGATDIAVFRSSSGLWAIRGVTRAFFGRRGDNPVPGVYRWYGSSKANAQCRDEIAIFRPCSGMWAVRGSSRFFFGGQYGDIPVTGDFKGNSLDEPGIFRPSSGLWSIRGFTRTYFGGFRDVPVTK